MKKQKNAPPLDAVMAAVIILIILALAGYGFLVQEIPAEAARFPLFVFGVILAAGVCEIIRSLRAQKEKDGEREMGPEHRPVKKVFTNPKNFTTICILIVGYVVLMYLVGFIPSTILFAVAFAYLFRFGHLGWYSAVAVAASIALYFCFTKLMFIHLPDGILFERLLG